ncbi:MAG: hypothetical protein A3C47_00070 [Omnitrophica bacterium RIFCSPHIGHO2_02_FULL_51_18]|nr:MAG: hypothetical protein A3C47_00070 [Omnitrophica bacterium RIFCSPHIGHO2_02_FULL_51_18]
MKLQPVAYIFLGFLSAVAAYFIHAAFKYTRMISGIFLSLVYKPAFENFSSGLSEKITILDSSDREVEALFVENKGSRKVLIFCHESGAPKESWEKYAHFIPGSGFHILSVDLQKPSTALAENSLSQWPTREDVERLLTVIRWAKGSLGADVKVVLFGVSNGADIALGASFADPAVVAVVADGLFSMKEIFRDYIRKWAPILVKPSLFGDKHPDWIVNLFTDLGFWYSQKKSGAEFVDVEKLLRKKHVPILMIHGGVDDYAPGTHQAFLEKINSDRKSLERFVVPNARHNQAVVVAKGAYEEKIINFLEKS